MHTKFIKDTIAGIEPTKEKIDEIYEKLLMEKGELEEMEKRKGYSGKIKKLLPIVAVSTIIISTTALAYMGVNSNFLKYLNERNIVNGNLIGDIDIDDYVYNIDKEISNENGALHIKQAIMDKDNLLIYMSFESKKDIDFTGENRRYSFKGDILNKQWFSEDEAEREKLMDEFEKFQDDGLLKVVEKGSTISINGVEVPLTKEILES